MASSTVETVKNEVTEFVEDPGAYFEQLKCDISVWWNRNKASVIKGLVGLGAFALTAVATAATGGLGLVFAGAAVGAWQYGANSLVDQNYSIYKVDYAKVGKEALKGGVISIISGGAGQLAANAAAPLSFCGQSFLQAAGDVATHWAAGFVADGATGMATTFASELIDGKSLEEAFDATISNSGDIWGNAALTASFGTIADAMVAPKCFVAGTMVVTAAGLVAIENIQPGDMVLAANEETGEYAYKEVVRTFVNTTEEITHVTISNGEGVQEVIDSTPQHPFYVEGKGWVEASALHAGMTIWFANGTKGTVEDISNEGLEEPVTVYNFEVADFHTYFVGECGVLVHNACTKLEDGTVVVTVSEDKYPESAQHAQEAIENGQPEVLTIDRNGASDRRKEALNGQTRVPGMDLDEYPPAMFAEGGSGASVKPISPSDNRGSGASIGRQLRDYEDGTKVIIKYVSGGQ